jgi:outer membrane protein TolC
LPAPPQTAPPADPLTSAENKNIRPVAHQEPAAPEPTLPVPTVLTPDPDHAPPQTPPFAGMTELTVDALVQAVLERSPTLAEMVAAWKAAQARYPQVTSLDDPLFGTNLAPAFASRVGNGYRVEIFQRYQWPGKLRLRGEAALAEASAAGRDVENVRQQLIESARDAFYDYYLSYRALEVNAQALRLVRDVREGIEDRYKRGLVLQQDLLQADVEIGRLREREILLERQRQVAIARIDSLLHLPPSLPLPPPPRVIQAEGELPNPQALLAQALAQRLDLLKLADQIKAAEAAVQLAHREYYPDVDAMAAYDAFWDNPLQRAQVAMRVNLPVRLKRRRGAVAEAEGRLAELKAQYARQTDQAGFEVQQAYEQWHESLRIIQLFDKEVLPAAHKNVEAAKSNYAAGRIPFVTLIEAQRGLVGLQDRYYEATADFFRRRTALQRSLTGTPATTPIPILAERPGPGQPGYPTGMGIGAR